MLGLLLLYVGAVLILNGIWLLGRIDDREIVLINLVVAGISLLVAAHSAVLAVDVTGVRAAAMTLLFAITYLWIAYNRLRACDGRGLGWFSLFVAITVLPVAVTDLLAAQSAMDLVLAVSWVAWAALWFLYFLLLVPRQPIQRLTAIATLLVGITTGWLPGLALLFGA